METPRFSFDILKVRAVYLQQRLCEVDAPLLGFQKPLLAVWKPYKRQEKLILRDMAKFFYY